MTSHRVTGKAISTDLSRLEGDTTTWEYDLAIGLRYRKASADGNQTLIQTETGIWRVTYNVQNRAVRFENESSDTVITCDYDYLGRRVFKKVEKDGVVTSHERYLYRDYLQIASLDMMEGQNQALINAYVWDPTQPVATRPLAIFYKGVAYYYGWDLTKNITEIFSLSARLQIDYVYTPFGQVRENGIIPQSARRLAGRLDKSAAFAPKGRGADGAAVSQSIQWSSEYHDAETGLVYYNYRYYNPLDGRWTKRDPMEETKNAYAYINNRISFVDILGLVLNNHMGGVGLSSSSVLSELREQARQKANDVCKNNPRMFCTEVYNKCVDQFFKKIGLKDSENGDEDFLWKVNLKGFYPVGTGYGAEMTTQWSNQSGWQPEIDGGFRRETNPSVSVGANILIHESGGGRINAGVLYNYAENTVSANVSFNFSNMGIPGNVTFAGSITQNNTNGDSVWSVALQRNFLF